MERKELIKLCEDAVVHHTKWNNRDSYGAQRKIQSIYKGLTAGLDYKVITKEMDPMYHTSLYTIIMEFKQPINFKKLEKGLDLKISSREDYFRDCDPDYETEMFDSDGIDFTESCVGGYLPTRECLNIAGIGNDWY